MKEKFFRILFCDDDSSFAQSHVDILQDKLNLKFGWDSSLVEFTSITQLGAANKLCEDVTTLKTYDMIFCDLGWADQTLAGIQLLNDLREIHPNLYCILYTAQDENQAIRQALEWKLAFIDEIIRIEGTSYFETFLLAIQNKIHEKRNLHLALHENDTLTDQLEDIFSQTKADFSSGIKKISGIQVGSWGLENLFPQCNIKWLSESLNTKEKIQNTAFKCLEDILNLLTDKATASSNTLSIKGARLVEKNKRSLLKPELFSNIMQYRDSLLSQVQETLEKPLSLNITMHPQHIEIKLLKNLESQGDNVFHELEQHVQKFPYLEPHDLIPLDRSRYIEFVIKTYGGFPQMASQCGLSLNHLYRVNRKFKNKPFIVFKYETVCEIVGKINQQESQDIIKSLLPSLKPSMDF